MEIWLDTINIELIKQAQQLGILRGVTTNPSLLAGEYTYVQETLRNILRSQNGPVTAQVIGESCEEMIEESYEFQKISKRIIIKIPVTKEGLKAIHLLNRQNIQTMATTVFHPNQAMLAALAGADYIAPYLGRIESSGENAFAYIDSIMRIFKNYNFKTKVLAASIKNLEQVKRCAESGVHAVTLKDEMFNKLTENHELTTQSLNQFSVDWKKALSQVH